MAKTEDTKAAAEKAAAEASKQTHRLRAVYGRMVDPHTGTAYDQSPEDYPEITPWVQSQIDAKKIEAV